MSRLTGLPRPVYTVSRCPKRTATSHPGGGGVITPPSIQFVLESIDCRSKTDCETSVRVTAGFDDTTIYKLTLAKRNSWVVTQQEVTGMT